MSSIVVVLWSQPRQAVAFSQEASMVCRSHTYPNLKAARHARTPQEYLDSLRRIAHTSPRIPKYLTKIVGACNPMEYSKKILASLLFLCVWFVRLSFTPIPVKRAESNYFTRPARKTAVPYRLLRYRYRYWSIVWKTDVIAFD